MVKTTRKGYIDISVILTGYNEGPSVEDNLLKVKQLLDHSKYKWEMILFDDRSSDATPDAFAGFARKYKNIRAYFHKRNIGRGGTVIDAIKKSRGRFVGYIDTDLELSPVYVFEFIQMLERGFDIVIATRFYTVSPGNLLRTIISKGYIFLMKLLLNLEFKDTEAGFKFFNKRKIMPILKKIEDKRWFFDTELVARSYLSGLKIAEIPVVYIQNRNKKSSVRIFQDSTDYFRKLLKFRKIVRNTR